MKQHEQTILEEQNRIIELAGKFDALVVASGWNTIVEHLSDHVNNSIAEAATADPLNPQQQTLHVLRWNAKRELLDSALNYINETRKERDRILEERTKEGQERDEYISRYTAGTGV